MAKNKLAMLRSVQAGWGKWTPGLMPGLPSTGAAAGAQTHQPGALQARAHQTPAMLPTASWEDSSPSKHYSYKFGNKTQQSI